MAQRMAAMQAMLNSMTPEQRAQLQGLSEQLLEDMDLRWQMDQLGGHLQQLFPQMGWERRYDFSGQDPLGFAEAAQMLNELGDLDQLENLLRGPRTRRPGRGRRRPGPRPARRRRRPQPRAAGEAGPDARGRRPHREQGGPLRAHAEGHPQDRPATPCPTCSRSWPRTRWAATRSSAPGAGHERTYDTKPYEFGDPFNLHIERTVRNAIRRQGGGTPVRLTPDDFEIERTEQLVRSRAPC